MGVTKMGETPKGTLFTISAPSGAGKTSLVRALLDQDDNTQVSVSFTTRAMRPGELDGRDYHFIDKNRFDDMLANTEFLEHAKVFTNYYGTSQAWVDAALARGKDVILEIDWQGAAQIRGLLPETEGIFILPPSRGCLQERLRGRGQDDEAVIEERMQEAKNEMSHFIDAQWLIINDDFEQALIELKSIVLAQRLKAYSQQQKYGSLLVDLLS
ncbi:MAG: guanylate kinase [Pseudohongiellaceae bacterium]|jgi:guanylate kinase